MFYAYVLCVRVCACAGLGGRRGGHDSKVWEIFLVSIIKNIYINEVRENDTQMKPKGIYFIWVLISYWYNDAIDGFLCRLWDFVVMATKKKRFFFFVLSCWKRLETFSTKIIFDLKKEKRNSREMLWKFLKILKSKKSFRWRILYIDLDLWQNVDKILRVLKHGIIQFM